MKKLILGMLAVMLFSGGVFAVEHEAVDQGRANCHTHGMKTAHCHINFKEVEVEQEELKVAKPSLWHCIKHPTCNQCLETEIVAPEDEIAALPCWMKPSQKKCEDGLEVELENDGEKVAALDTGSIDDA